ncbi:acyltransferase [uncultured Aquimarina sp.]|uniref:acyltransferase n=1 Tax=uncultured Aquimarina sp. TaxID=575652 RepID=UPI00262F0E95|nr:acyltransferase [uncultured Aquimarina sp.]
MESIIFRIINILINRPFWRIRLKKCGRNFKIGYSSELKNPQFFSIGNNFFSGPHGYFVTNKAIPVSIGDHVMFGPFCRILGGNHNIKFKENHIMYEIPDHHAPSKIVIEDGVWVGAGTTILDRAYISEGSIIAANAIINDFVPPYCIAIGAPIKKYKLRMPYEDLSDLLQNVHSKYTLEEIKKIHKKYNIS